MMQGYAGSYTSGATDTQSLKAVVKTAGPQVQVKAPKPVPIPNSLSQSWAPWASDRLEAIAKLGPNWDSYGGDPPSPRAIASATALLETVYGRFGSLDHEHSQPQIVAPRADGGIQIEWSTHPVEIAVHADPSGTLGYLYIDRHGERPTYREVPNAPLQDVLQLIATVVFTVPR
jgi:hypothetical protein